MRTVLVRSTHSTTASAVRRIARRGFLAALLAIAFPVATLADSILDLVPESSLFAYAAKPYGWLEAGATASPPTQKQTGALASLSTIVGLLDSGGLISEEGQVFVDVVAALPLLGNYEHALVLLDVSSRIAQANVSADGPAADPDQPSLRLGNLQAAVVFRCGADRDAIIAQIDRTVGRYTNQDVAKLTTYQAGDHSYQRLADHRLPGWAVWEWGALGDYYVITFGSGTFEEIAQAADGERPRLSNASWVRRAVSLTSADKAVATWYVSFTRLEKALGSAASGRLSNVVAALNARDMTDDFWALGQEGRALRCIRCYRRRGQDFVKHYSDPAKYDATLLSLVPDAARHLAVLQVPTRWLVDNLPRAWLAAQSESNRRKWLRAWQFLEQETGLDIDANLINHFGDHVLLYDYPPHPLRIPFALTIAIEIDDAKAVRSAISSLLMAWGKYLDERAERNQTRLVRLKVKKSADGIWYLQAGILGPAMKVTPRFVLISWSPEALREVLPRFEELPDRTAAGAK